MRHTPQRSCIGCRTTRDKRDLVRVVHAPDDRYLVDRTGKTPGRGAYLCPSIACLELAVKRKSFDRAFRQTLSKETVGLLETAMRDCLRAEAGAAAVEKDGPEARERELRSSTGRGGESQ